ncbi:hypothetical protein [Paraflavitalea speifideaquila]|uniref:hypothetical protein n=1 Tax=Paraflavitalea speifideaquila TaxID=3076558 RepID=UPI0028EA9082|nr:hypothetical protein [Paraflavitalea speifideiaquila]
MANSGSYVFDEAVENDIDGDSAITLDYYDRGDYAALLKKDPFFSAGNIGAAFNPLMQDSLRLFSRTIFGISQTDKNVLEYIDRMLYCKEQCNGWNSCVVDNDCRSANQEWGLYKQFYLNLKQRFYELARINSSNQVFANCANCYVGSTPLDIVDTCALSLTDFSVSTEVHLCTGTDKCKIYPAVQIAYKRYTEDPLPYPAVYGTIRVFRTNNTDTVVVRKMDAKFWWLFEIGLASPTQILIDSAWLEAVSCKPPYLAYNPSSSTCGIPDTCANGIYVSLDKPDMSFI